MPAVDGFSTFKPGLDSPYTDGEVVTPDDATEFAAVSRAVWVGGAGTVVALTLNDDVLTFTGVAAGTLLRIRAKRINATGTTATNMVALS